MTTGKQRVILHAAYFCSTTDLRSVARVFRSDDPQKTCADGPKVRHTVICHAANTLDARTGLRQTSVDQNFTNDFRSKHWEGTCGKQRRAGAFGSRVPQESMKGRDLGCLAEGDVPMNAAIKSPDVRDLARESLPAGVFPPGAPEFRVFFNPQTHGDILKHGSEDTSVEICGVLVGKIEKDGQGPFVSITNSIRGEAAESKFAEVTFTHQSWNKINAEMDSKYQNLRIVGWYHTHPSFGIFLSDRDRFIQEHFFNGPGQIAHVVDPVQKIEGVFTWQNGRPELCSAYWVGNETKSAPPPSSATGMAFGPATVGAPEANSSPAPPESGRDMLWWAIALLTFMLGFLLANFMATRLNDWEKLSLARAHVKSFLIWKVVKPDLDTNLSLLSTELGKTTKAAQQLASEHLKLTAEKDRETVKKHWDDVLHNLEVIDEAQRTMIQVYGLTGLEKQMVLRELAEIDARERELLKREEQKAAETKEDAQPKKSSDSEGSGSAGTR